MAIYVSIVVAVSVFITAPVFADQNHATLHVKIAFANGTLITDGPFTISLVNSNLQTLDSGHSPFNTKVTAGTYYLEALGIYDGQTLAGSQTITISSSDNSEHYLILVVTPAPAAIFMAEPTSGTAPLTVQFTDGSIGSISAYSWTFGDGIGSSAVQNPSYTYAFPGTYSATLTVTGLGGSDSASTTILVSPGIPPTPRADFTSDVVTGAAPLNVQFTDLSTNSPSSWGWTFGEGAVSDEQNPAYVYTDPGVYTVTLTASNASGSDTVTKTNYITVLPPAPVAGFTYNQPSQDAPSVVTFTSTSTGDELTYTWNFGGSEGMGTGTSVVHTFATPGTYPVSLTVTDSLGRISSITHDVTVNPAFPIASFSISQPSQDAPSAVTFTSTSTGDGLTCSWNFGGFEGTGTGPGTSHTYNTPGTYTVTLTVTDSLGRTSVTTHTVTVVAPTPVVSTPVVRFDPTACTVDENAGTVTLTVKLSEPASSDVTVAYSTTDGSAFKVTDYLEVAAGSVTIGATEDTATFTIPLVDDEIPGGNVYFLVDLLSIPTENAVIDENNREVTVTIADDETTYTVQLHKGWNMISAPLVIEPFKASEVRTHCPEISQVMQYDTSGQSFSAYLAGISPEEFDFAIRTDVGYLVYVSEATDITFVGRLPVDRSITLNPGWTMAGWSTFGESDAMSVAATMDDRQQIMIYDNPQISFTAYLEDISPAEFNFRMVPGGGYLIFTNTQTTLDFGGI